MQYRPYIKKDYKHVLGGPLLPTGGRRGRRKWPLLVTAGLGAVLALNLSANIRESEKEPAAKPAAIPLDLPSEDAEAVASLAPPLTRLPASTPGEPLDVPSAKPLVGDDMESSPGSTAAKYDLPAGPATAASPPGTSTESMFAAKRVVVKKGDTLSAIFHELGLDKREMYTLLADKAVKRKLSRLRPGQELEFRVNGENRIQSLRYRLDNVDSLNLSRNGDGFKSEWLKEELEIRVTSTTGRISNSLFQAGQKAELSNNLIMQMVELLGWDIDFATDIRSGDHFTVIYEQLFNSKGTKAQDGEILAVAFSNRGREIRAVRYVDPDGHTDYYSADGYSMRKAFLRTPVTFSRISSRFSKGRYHPVLNRIRAHQGVDYAAPIGTAVKATGDGAVSFKGWKGGYGRTVIIQHGGKYTTLYAHLSRYARGLRPGKRVRQGQVIGYVGKSGLATGPHLHYEFRVRNQHRDPLRVRLPKAAPIAEKYREDFARKTQPLVAQLERLRYTRLAQSDG